METCVIQSYCDRPIERDSAGISFHGLLLFIQHDMAVDVSVAYLLGRSGRVLCM